MRICHNQVCQSKIYRMQYLEDNGSWRTFENKFNLFEARQQMKAVSFYKPQELHRFRIIESVTQTQADIDSTLAKAPATADNADGVVLTGVDYSSNSKTKKTEKRIPVFVHKVIFREDDGSFSTLVSGLSHREALAILSDYQLKHINQSERFSIIKAPKKLGSHAVEGKTKTGVWTPISVDLTHNQAWALITKFQEYPLDSFVMYRVVTYAQR